MKQMTDAKFDILKLFLALLIVFGHTEPEGVIQIALHPWIKIAVPFFFIMTGYFLFRKAASAPTQADRSHVIRGFVLRTVKLYCFWFVLLIPFSLYQNRSMEFENGTMGFVEHALKRLFFGSTYTASWYMTACIFGVLIVAALSKKLSNRTLLVITVPVFLFVTGWTCYLPFLQEGGWLQQFYALYYRVLSNPHHSFPAALVWLVVGKCFAEQTFDFRSRLYPALAVLSGILLYIEWQFVGRHTALYNGESYFLLLPFCTSLFALFLRIPPVQIRGTQYIRRCSTYVYVMHGTLLAPVSRLVHEVFRLRHSVFAFLLNTAVCIAVYALAQGIVNRRKGRLSTLLTYSY